MYAFTLSRRKKLLLYGLRTSTCAANANSLAMPLTAVHKTAPNPQGVVGRPRLKCDGTRAETRFRLSAKRTNPFKSAGTSVQSTTGSRGVRISGSNAGYTMFRGSVKGTGYPFHSPVSPSLPHPCATVCHHISTGLYNSEERPETACDVTTQGDRDVHRPVVTNSTPCMYEVSPLFMESK